MSFRALRRALALLLTVVASAVLLVGPAAAAQPPKLKDPSVTGRDLSDEFLTILQQGDMAALGKFLDPAFQLQRADGTGVTKAEYLAKPAVVGQYRIGDAVQGTQDDDVLVVRWSVSSELQVDGTPYAATEAPRLSTYHWNGKRWRLVSHANFNKPA
jgi:hypothetical protein